MILMMTSTSKPLFARWEKKGRCYAFSPASRASQQFIKVNVYIRGSQWQTTNVNKLKSRRWVVQMKFRVCHEILSMSAQIRTENLLQVWLLSCRSWVLLNLFERIDMWVSLYTLCYLILLPYLYYTYWYCTYILYCTGSTCLLIWLLTVHTCLHHSIYIYFTTF